LEKMDGRIGDAPVNGCQTRQQTAARQRERDERAMPVDARDRVTVDLRGLGFAAKEQAVARKLTLAAFARMAIVEKLKQTTDVAKRSGVLHSAAMSDDLLKGHWIPVREFMRADAPWLDHEDNGAPVAVRRV
jgi:hypothetical protein